MKKGHLARRAVVAAVTVFAALVGVGSAAAQIHPRVATIEAQWPAASVAQRYTLVRSLWQSWELADPTHIEGSLSAIAQDHQEAPAVRAYAGLLEAYARRRRGDTAGAKRRISALGYVDDWLVVGPFDNDNKSGLNQRYVPEQELAEPIVFDRSFEGKVHTVHWRRSPRVHPYGYLDLAAMMRPQRDICVYASSYIKAQDKARDISLWVGATGAYQLFFGGQPVLKDEHYRVLDADRHSVAVHLDTHFQRLTAKVCGDETPPMLALRVAELDGSPARGVVVAASEQASTEAAAQLRAGRGATKPSHAAAPGSIQRFEQALAAAPDDAAQQSAYARFLARTGADPENSHQARDLATRAANAAPTVKRLLLAAELSQDTNDKRVLIERAEKRAVGSLQRANVLLARASLLRAGAAWRQAFPLYDEVLRVDPNNVRAMLGKTDLYVEAGLKRTALATLQAASEGQPRSVALRRALAGQLRALGRATEAHEAEARYAAMRFDDAGYLAEQLRLAVARRDKAGAQRWSDRLLEQDPSSLWGRRRAAHAMLSLGDSRAARAHYAAALAIAPDDLPTLKALADLQGQTGQRQRQIATLKTMQRLAPQDKRVRAYLEYIAPSTARDDEKYAWTTEQLLAKRAQFDQRHDRRTLRQLQVTTVYDSGLASHFHQVAYQPLTAAAAERSRSYVFYYHADRQTVNVRAARVLRKDGRVDEAIESGHAPVNDPTINMYTSQRAYIIRFPRLEPGDVVELRYRIQDVAARNELADYFGEVVSLQSDEPIASVEYVLVAPKDKQLHMSHSQLPHLKTSDEVHGDRRIRRVWVDDVAAIEREPRMPPLSELLAHVHVSTFPSWSEVGRWYWTLARDKVDADDNIRALARELVKGKTDERAKVAAIYRHVGSEVRYVALELGIEGIRPRSAALTLARGWGDCKDKATLMVSMLREVGIEAELVLVRTRLRGDFDTTTASLAPFDHAIAYVPTLDLYLDGTAEITGTGELPAMDRGAVGLRISGGEGKLVRLSQPPPARSRATHQLSLQLAANGDISFTADVKLSGALAPRWRQRLLPEVSRRERVAAELASDLGTIKLLPGARGMQLANRDDFEVPVAWHLAGTTHAERRDGKWALPTGPQWRLAAAYLQSAHRKYDLLLGHLRERRDDWTVKVAAGMTITHVPSDVSLSTPFADYSIKSTRQGGEVRVQTLLRWKQTRIKPGDYAAFARYCRQVDSASSHDLVVAPR